LLADGRILEVWPMMFNLRLIVTLPENDNVCWDDAWCYNQPADALLAFAKWDGEGEPAGWNKHPMSGRWRKDGTQASEVNTREA
jgi:hypothetical protein